MRQRGLVGADRVLARRQRSRPPEAPAHRVQAGAKTARRPRRARRARRSACRTDGRAGPCAGTGRAPRNAVPRHAPAGRRRPSERPGPDVGDRLDRDALRRLAPAARATTAVRAVAAPGRAQAAVELDPTAATRSSTPRWSSSSAKRRRRPRAHGVRAGRADAHLEEVEDADRHPSWIMDPAVSRRPRAVEGGTRGSCGRIAPRPSREARRLHCAGVASTEAGGDRRGIAGRWRS